MMRYYKVNDEVFAFSEDQLDLIKPNMVQMSYEEVNRHINPLNYLTQEEKYKKYLTSLKPLTRRQFKLALLNEGLLNQVETIINNIEDTTERARMQIEYTEANEFHRTSESVATMIALLGLNEDQVNTMWENAITL